MTDKMEQLENLLARMDDDDFGILYDFIISEGEPLENLLTTRFGVAEYNYRLGKRELARHLTNIRNRALEQTND